MSLRDRFPRVRFLRVTAGATLALATAVAVLAVRRVPAAEPSAAEIMAKNVQARGGLEAWRQVETMVWAGHIESARVAMAGMQFRLEQKRPNKTRLQIDTHGERSVRIFDGTHGWRIRGAHGRPDVQPYTPQEVAAARSAHVIDGPLLDAAAKSLPVSVKGIDDIDGRHAYHLVVRTTDGKDEDVWVDGETFLEIRYDRMVDGAPGKPRRLSVTYGDYRTVQGLQLPFLLQTGGGQGTVPDKMQIELVVLNVPMQDWIFGNPSAPRRDPRQSAAARGPAPTAPSAAKQEPASAAP